MSQKAEKITRNQRKAINALLRYKTIEEAAGAIGVNPKTVFRWLDDTTFRLALSQAEGEALDRIGRRLLAMSEQALSAIQEILDDPKKPGNTNLRLSAALILNQTMRLRELRNIESRLADLERAVF